jgi:hypothetical protein
MTTIETKKTLQKFIKEIFYWGIKAWPLIFLIEFIFIHALLLSLLPIHSRVINAWVSSSYQVIGAFYIIVQLNESLKTLKNIDLIESIKNYWKQKPERISRNTTIHLTACGITAKAAILGTPTINSGVQTLEEKIDFLSKRMDNIEKRINKNRKELIDNIRTNQKNTSKQIGTIIEDIKTLQGNVTETIVGDYKKAIFGFLLVNYGICVPIINTI